MERADDAEQSTKPAVPGEEITDKVLVWSLRSNLCPACKGLKRAHNTLCPPCYRSLPYGLRNALYDRLGQGIARPSRRRLLTLKRACFTPRKQDPKGSKARMPTITLHLGQAVPWRAAPAGIAQIFRAAPQSAWRSAPPALPQRAGIRRVVLPVSAIDRLIRDFPLLSPTTTFTAGNRSRQKTYVSPPPVQAGAWQKTLLSRNDLCEIVRTVRCARRWMSRTLYNATNLPDRRVERSAQTQRSEIKELVIVLGTADSGFDSADITIAVANRRRVRR